MDKVSANVGADDEWVVVWVVLKPEVGFGKCDWNMGPRGVEMFAFAHVGDCVEIFFSIPLHLVHMLVGPTGDGINDIYRASDGVIGSFWDCARF